MIIELYAQMKTQILHRRLIFPGIAQITADYLAHRVVTIAGDGLRGLQNGDALSCKFGRLLGMART